MGHFFRSNYLDLNDRLKARLKELPRGSILKRRIGRHEYFYLKVRDGNRVRSRYLGKKKPEEMEKAIKERRLLKQQLKEVEGNMKLLARLEKRRNRGRAVSKAPKAL
ncbi:MAG: hypothetical protein A2506_06305 [Elusimicrobia bacterium RIFOXYD12_FULL_66_9]|nr:MAG: hypothetical protein A2506_06305 [Elusimicrobia bacterium RIFOXYD12_FULL_66_9]